MKILQINCVYNYGSTGKIVHDIHTELQKRNIESIVCYGRRQRTIEPNIYKTCGELYSKFNNLLTRVTGIMYGGCFFSTRNLINIIKKEKPDIVHLHCLNGYFVNVYRLIEYLKTRNIKTILTLHAEFMYTANCGHALDCNKWLTGCGNCPKLRKETKSLFFDRTAKSWQLMKKAFEGFKNLYITSVSPWLKERAEQSPILKNFPNCVIYNGINTNVFHPFDKTILHKNLNIKQNTKILFYVVPYFNINKDNFKGGNYIMKIAQKFGEKIQIFVAGRYDNINECPNNVKMLGYIDNQQLLAKYYSVSDLTLLTSKKETFSMPCAESLCCGTPVVGFKAGAPEQISLSKYSKFCEYGDIDALCKLVQDTFKTNYNSVNISKEAAQVYSVDTMVDNFIKQYKILLRNDKR